MNDTFTCGQKRKYESEIDAKAAIAGIAAQGNKTALFVYYHWRCRGWHLTSHPRDEIV